MVRSNYGLDLWPMGRAPDSAAGDPLRAWREVTKGGKIDALRRAAWLRCLRSWLDRLQLAPSLERRSTARPRVRRHRRTPRLPPFPGRLRKGRRSRPRPAHGATLPLGTRTHGRAATKTATLALHRPNLPRGAGCWSTTGSGRAAAARPGSSRGEQPNLRNRNATLVCGAAPGDVVGLLPARRGSVTTT